MSHLGRRIGILTWLLLAALAGCRDHRGSDSGLSGSQVLYVVDQNGASTGFLIDATTGALEDTGTSTGLPISAAMQFSAHPSGKFVYATLSHGASPGAPTTDIMAYAVTSTGTLSPLPGSPFSAADYSPQISDSDYSSVPKFDPAGNFLYVGSRSGCQVFSIDHASGAITPIPGSPFAGPMNQNNPMASNCGVTVGSHLVADFAVPTNEGIDTLYDYAVDPTSGALTLTNSTFQFTECCGAGIRIPAVSGNSLFTSYLSNLEVLSVDGTSGAFSKSIGVGTPQPWDGVAAMDPSGKFIFFASPGNPDGSGREQLGQLNGYSFNSNYSLDGTIKALTPLSPDSTTVDSWPVTMTFDHTGKFLYVISFDRNTSSATTNIYAFKFDSTDGTLTPAPGTPYALRTLSPESAWNQMLIGELP